MSSTNRGDEGSTAVAGEEAPPGVDSLDVNESLRDAVGDSAWESAFGGQDQPEDEAVHDLKPGDMVGKYKLVEQIGEGGMGVVWKAEALGEVTRQVAVKVIGGSHTREVLARFRRERATMSVLDHPGIAQIYDEGTTADRRPFFVMELVGGGRSKPLPLTTFCDEHRYGLEERLKLFVDVCQAMQHADRAGIVHRDLKPANILVALDGETPRAKVIDFGIAKALDSDLTGQSFVTETGAFVGTPEYTAPEQADNTSGDIDGRTDVYSLGVILFELLSGCLPFNFDVRNARDASVIQRAIHNATPARPSEALKKAPHGRVMRIVTGRDTSFDELIRALDRDLERIPLRAIQKAPADRYASAAAMAAEIQKYLAGEAIEADQAALPYKTNKFLERNRTGILAASAAAGVALVVGFGAGWATSSLVSGTAPADAGQTELAAQVERIRTLEQTLVDAGVPVPGETEVASR
jgi:serine/threonine protein kinase